jgi:hypothetical protein
MLQQKGHELLFLIIFSQNLLCDQAPYYEGRPESEDRLAIKKN